jgi:hypothetical protein
MVGTGGRGFVHGYRSCTGVQVMQGYRYYSVTEVVLEYRRSTDVQG